MLTAKDVREWFEAFATDMGSDSWHITDRAIGRVSREIVKDFAQAHEQEMSRVQFSCGHPVACIQSGDEGTNHCGWCASEDAHAGEITRLRAQAAEMAEALSDLLEHGGMGGEAKAKAQDKAEQALQSAPTVLDRIKAKRTTNISGDILLAFPWQENGVRVIQAYDSAMENYGNEWVDVIVLEGTNALQEQSKAQEPDSECTVNDVAETKSEQEENDE